MDASLRGGAGFGPLSRFVRFIHCRGGIGVFVDMDCARTVEEHKIREKRNLCMDWDNRDRRGPEIII